MTDAREQIAIILYGFKYNSAYPYKYLTADSSVKKNCLEAADIFLKRESIARKEVALNTYEFLDEIGEGTARIYLREIITAAQQSAEKENV